MITEPVRERTTSCDPLGLGQHAAGLLAGDAVDQVVAEEDLRRDSAGSAVLGSVVGGNVDSRDGRGRDHLDGHGLADAFRSISPLSIESITVLKDDSPEAKAYGENVSVIKIQTKREENGLLESLKNLPGVKVEADGSITVNGQHVKKITINGRSYSVSSE